MFMILPDPRHHAADRSQITNRLHTRIHSPRQGMRTGLPVGSTAPGVGIGKQFTIDTTTTGQSPLTLGNNTAIQRELNVRCPTWSPGFAGAPAGTLCSVTIFVQSRAALDAGQAYCSATHFVPSNWSWEPLLLESCGTPSDDEIVVWIDTNGFPMDIDNLWIGSGI